MVGLACLPLFLLLLGREAYGLIGAFAVVQAWTLLLDFGLTPTLNREIARARAGARDWQSISNLLRSVELVAFALAMVLVGTVVLIAAKVGAVWLHPKTLSPAAVEVAVIWMGALAAVRWIEQVYRGALQGSEDQVWLNGVLVGVETLRWGGALLLIYLVAPDVMLFFAWNLLVSASSALVIRSRLERFLRAHGAAKGQFQLAELRAVRRFAGGMFLSSLLTFLLTQSDKLVVGRFAELSDFGLYALAATSAAGLLQLVQPISIAILPRLTGLVAISAAEELRTSFRVTSEWMAMIVVPVAMTVLVLPERALHAWTGQSTVATAAAPALSFLMLASLFNALANVPYALQLAHGWTSLTNKLNALLLVLMLPAMIEATRSVGSAGAAAVLAILNLVSLVLLSTLVLSRLLPEERWRWAGRAVIAPLLVAGVTTAVVRAILPGLGGRAESLAQFAVAYALTALTTASVLPHPRRALLARLLPRRPAPVQ